MAGLNGRLSYLLRCNGAAGDRHGRRGRNPRGPVASELWTFGGARNVRLCLNDITDAMLRRLPDRLLDLLELATLVYAADQFCRRTPGRRFDYGIRWRRHLRFRVAVRLPEFWSNPTVLDSLTETLHFLSEDDYEFEFTRVEEPPAVQEYLNYGPAAPPPASVDQVMLMSGGLDSLAGAADAMLLRRLRLAMVSHTPVGHVARRQRDLATALGDRANELPLKPFHIPVTAHKLGLEEHDITQRTRSFLYASLGAAVAHLYRLDEVWFYENGIVSVNLPLCAQEVGGHATRTTHPQSLHGFERVLSLVLDRPFGVKNGFFWQTKQDVLEVIERCQQRDLVRTSVSCSHTRRITDPAPHCGMCSQCLSRRVAALGAKLGLDDPIEGYRKEPLVGERDKDEERILAERFIGQARAVARMTAVQQFHTRYAGELSRVYPYLNMSPAVAAEKLFDLHLRHAKQVSDAVVGQIKEHAEDYWNGTLGRASALSFAFGTSRSSRRAAAAVDSRDKGDASALKLDEETFTVAFGEKRYVFRGRQTQLLFALLARIGRRPGQRVWFDQLRENNSVWGGRTVEDVTIRGAVGRLKQELADAGLHEVRDAISTGSVQGRPYVIIDLSSEAPDRAGRTSN